MSLLSIRDLCAGYADIDIIRHIDIEVDTGEIVTITGTNGAGKSTLSKALLGLTPRISGAVVLAGQDITRVDAEKRIACGIGYVPQVANVFDALTVMDNLRVVQHVDHRETRIGEMLEIFPALEAKLKLYAGMLSGGERQMLAFARALMSRPHLMVLDEPTAALSPGLVMQVFRLVKELPRQGVAVLLVEQRARQSLAMSDRGYILDQGCIVLEGAAADLLNDERMARLYLGTEHAH